MRHERAKNNRNNIESRRAAKIASAIWVSVIMLLGGAMGVAIAVMINTTTSIPVDVGDIRPTQATKIFSSDGVLLGTVYQENREVVRLKEIPKDLRNAVIAVEDSRFYSHNGIDIKGIVRAIISNLRGGRVVQGGSTITQQLARNIYLSQRRTLNRKLQEAALAIRLERNYSKDQILELYLNQVYFGSRAYGVQTASKVYFGKNVKDLTLGECALLAGLPQRPSDYSPYENLNLALARRSVVLDRMAELGYISRETAEKVKKEPVKLVGLKNNSRGFLAPYFTSFVIKELSGRYGEDVINKSGFKVITTLNYKMQKSAEEALINGVKNARRLNVSQGALVAIENETGFIRAMVGGVDYNASQWNRAVQARRQPGSAFKIFVYTAAVAKGIKPNDRYSGAPKKYIGANGKSWTPSNYGGKRYGTITVRQAISWSVNTVAVKILEEIGVNEAIKYARLMGITSPLDPYLSLALGSSVVSPLEMASAVSVLATGGYRVPPSAILRVEDPEGVVLEEAEPLKQKVLEDNVVKTMNELLRAVVTDRGATGSRAIAVPNAHGKTGTTNDNRDAWFVGYTPELSCAVWVGNDSGQSMRSVTGGVVSVPIWANFMLKALPIERAILAARKGKTRVVSKENTQKTATEDNVPHVDLPEIETAPRFDTVTRIICSESQFLATSACPRKYSESFERGSEPTEYCPIHRRSQIGTFRESTSEYTAEPEPEETTSNETVKVTICADTGLIANKYCPRKVVRTFQAGRQPVQVCAAHRSIYTYY